MNKLNEIKSRKLKTHKKLKTPKSSRNRKNDHNKTLKNRRYFKYLNRTLRKSSIQKYIDKKSTCVSNVQAFEAEYQKGLREVKGEKRNIQKEISHILRKKFVPKRILPNNDFYTFINYEWMKSDSVNKPTKEEEYIVQFDDFRIVQNEVYYQLIDIVNDYIKNNNTNLSREINNVYKAGLKLLDDAKAKIHLNEYIDFLDKCRSMSPEKGAWFFLGTMNKNEIISGGLPFVMSLNPDEKDPRISRIYISQPDFSLVDFDVYIEDGENMSYKSNYKKQYYKYIDQLFTAFFGKNHEFNPRDIFECEQEMIFAIVCDKEKDVPYKKITKGEAETHYKFDFNHLTKAFGFKSTPDFFITNNSGYIRCGTQVFMEGWTSKKWRTYYIYIYMRQVARFHKTWRSFSYEFMGKFMRGQESPFPAELICVFNLAFSFNSFLTNEYIRKYANIAAINYVKTMAEDLRLVYKRIITRNSWLQPETKRHAIKKLDNFTFDIGSPKELRKDPLLNYTDDDIWENLRKIIRWRSLSVVELEGRPNVDIPTIDWMQEPFKFTGSQSYVVNAYYTPTENGIYVPIAYLQKPFIDLEERGIEYNLSTIGFTVAHEMSHSLDNSGSDYDYNGSLHNWWTKKDIEIFKRKQNDVIRQYEEFALRDGIKLDASISIGEDLADISGLAICLEYLRDFTDKNKDVIPIRVISFKAFMIYYAIQFKQKISRKALIAQIKTNPHPLDKYRTNIPLSRIQIFRDMYDVKSKNGMWWHNTDTIW